LLYDALNLSFRELKLRRNPDCKNGECVCIKELIDYQQFCGVPNQPADQTKVPIDEITVADYQAQRQEKIDHILIDVREPHEYDICAIEGSRLIPLNDLGKQLNDLPKDKPYIVHCKSGGRSEKAVRQMKEKGFSQVSNLIGGILKWAEEIDSSMPKY
jgi:sulfur-carrier protein adenylyltransferase/sulfurtransferase